MGYTKSNNGTTVICSAVFCGERDSFAALNEGIELDLIAQITSHSDVEVMRPYIASTRKGKQKVVDALDNATQE